MTKAIMMDPRGNVATLRADVEPSGTVGVRSTSGTDRKAELLGHRDPIAVYWARPVSKQKCGK